ncbi:hypothetical protein AB0D45_33020 [Streptomyces sp. NPDC048352]|uniref:hypothetical protein n=1 Tax=Streptomyces sp. NPDC048352 TaxID=3154718 RepID=UPI003420B4C0
MSTNRSAPKQLGAPVININLSGNAQLNCAYGDQMASNQSDAGAESPDKHPFWKSMIFWTAVGVIATAAGAIAAFL